MFHSGSTGHYHSRPSQICLYLNENMCVLPFSCILPIVFPSFFHHVPSFFRFILYFLILCLFPCSKKMHFPSRSPWPMDAHGHLGSHARRLKFQEVQPFLVGALRQGGHLGRGAGHVRHLAESSRWAMERNTLDW